MLAQTFLQLMKRNSISSLSLLCLFTLFGSAMELAAQVPAARGQALIDNASNRWWYTMAFIVAAGFGLAFYLWRKSKKGAEHAHDSYANRHGGQGDQQNSEGIDAARELEWFRKAKKPAQKARGAKNGKAGTTYPLDEDIDTRIFQETMRKLQYAQLPINTFSELTPAEMYNPLPVSNDPSLINAIEQANEEFEEDETIRELSVRILMAFRNRNAVDSLAQIALYDLSAALRSKAVSALADFDHDSVFETILLACADPTREVRAAAARGLFRLNFDRADAWKRIIETHDGFRMRHAARAAIESGIVEKSFDRLIHDDLKVAYEAFALVSLLISSGETDEIFATLKSHKDERVKFAVLHVLKANKDARVVSRLREMILDTSFHTDVTDRIRETIASFETVPASVPA